MLEHIYSSKHQGDSEIKLLCSDKWVKVEEIRPERSHSSDGCTIDGIRQWSKGAGHNSNCPECLIKLAELKMETDKILTTKILDLAKKGVLNVR